MSFAEAGVVISKNHEVIAWHLPPNRSGGALPDSRPLWDILWDAHRSDTLLGFAHTHPGAGIPHPSTEDITTFRAVEKALGRRVTWWIASSDVLVTVNATSPTLIASNNVMIAMVQDWPWVAELRARSRVP